VSTAVRVECKQLCPKDVHALFSKKAKPADCRITLGSGLSGTSLSFGSLAIRAFPADP